MSKIDHYIMKNEVVPTGWDIISSWNLNFLEDINKGLVGFKLTSILSLIAFKNRGKKPYTS